MEFEISLNGLSFYAYHGVLEEERRIGNEFRVDISVFIPLNPGIEADNLEHTVSYATVYKIIEGEMSRPQNLLEKVALNIAERLQQEFCDIKQGLIKIEKKRPPIPGMIGSASVTLRF